MKNIFLNSILTISVILYLGLSASAQRKDGLCVMANGQLGSCPPTQQSNGCMQNMKFNTLYPFAPYQHKTYSNEKVTSQNPRSTPFNSPECKIVSWGFGGRYCSATYSYITKTITDFYMTDTSEFVKASSTITYREDRDYPNTQVSLGHTLINGFVNINGVRYGPTLIPGNTNAVNKGAFNCIMQVTASEAAMMANEMSASIDGGLFNDFRPVGNIWVRIR